MFLRGSRYEEASPFLGEDGSPSPFRGARPRDIGPALGVVEHTVVEGDRLDLMARHYYDDGRLWWRIADANPELTSADGLDGLVGRVILIPKARE